MITTVILYCNKWYAWDSIQVFDVWCDYNNDIHTVHIFSDCVRVVLQSHTFGVEPIHL